jgi:xanthine dehydrogenase D subunit
MPESTTRADALARVTAVSAGVGESPRRIDGAAKVTGTFSYASDLRCDGMLWGVTLRSPHPFARIRSIDVSEALTIPGVHVALTHADLPETSNVGLEVADQPVLAVDIVRYQGEPVALIGADDDRTARRAAERIKVEYDVLEPVTDVRAALDPGTPPLHPDGNLVRHRRLTVGDPEAVADVVVTGEYRTGTQDQAFLSPESGLAVPDGHGGINLYLATQGLHNDQRQICAALGLPPERVRLTLSGVGGAFGGREDISMQVHACALALRSGRPVKMVYTRAESFLGHPHRHPALLRYEHGFRRDGTLLYVRGEVFLDGGAYASSTGELVANVSAMGTGPYLVPNVTVDCYGVYTNNPPCGAMRGFGMVQVAFACESQMDKAAAALGLDPVDLRMRNAMREGATVPTGQVLDSPTPVAELLRRVRDLPMPATPDDRGSAEEHTSATAISGSPRRGTGYAAGYKSVAFSEGFDDYSTARVRLELVRGEPSVTVYTAAAEVGQGVMDVERQICRTELGIEHIVVRTRDTAIGSAGPSSASRQTYVTGGAVKAACEQVRDRLVELTRRRTGEELVRLMDGKIICASAVLGFTDVLSDGEALEETVTWRHRATYPLDPETGQGFAHVQYAFCAHRAVVEVDTELGLVKVLELACAQDVGRAINPQAVEGQIHGGTVQGLGLALMEELQVDGSVVTNASFTDYLLPTMTDVPPMPVDIVELPDPHAPYGLRGVGEPSSVSSTPAIVAAIRSATGRELPRVPVRPEDIVGLTREP